MVHTHVHLKISVVFDHEFIIKYMCFHYYQRTRHMFAKLIRNTTIQSDGMLHCSSCVDVQRWETLYLLLWQVTVCLGRRSTMNYSM